MKAYHLVFLATDRGVLVKMDAETGNFCVFPSKLGWMAICTGSTGVRRLTFGHSTCTDATKSLGDVVVSSSRRLPWHDDVIELLQAYADRTLVDFTQVPIEIDDISGFRRRVLTACRRIAYGKTLTYGRLAAKAGATGAARAVGTCMARNPLPLIIPCHRVIRSDGHIGPFSAVGGSQTKRRLLEMEAANSTSGKRKTAMVS